MKEWKTLVILFSAALIFRILHFLIFANWLVVGNDQMQNITLARRFAAGDFYGVLDIYWTPLYPILIGIVTLFCNSLVLPSVIISVIAGSFAAPLTYCLVRQSYGRREALIAAVIAVFYAHLINSVFGIGTENIYFLWIIGALIVGWRALNTNSATDFLLTGILYGLAYLTRPEAAGYVLFFAFLAFSKNLWQKKLFSHASTVQIAALLLGFAILAAPYIVYLRNETGVWTISGKVGKNLAAGAFQENDDADSETDTPDTLQNYSAETGRILARNVVLSLIEIQKIFNYLFPILLMIFIALGLFNEKWDRQRLWREGYLILFCLTTVIGYALAVSQVRYFYILLPIFFGWMASGIIYLERWLHDSFQNWLPSRFYYLINSKSFIVLCLIFIFLYVLPVNFYMRPKQKAWRSNAFEERDAGLWLKKNGKPSPLVFSAGLRPVFYAQGRQIQPNSTVLYEILSEIQDSKPDYVITGERYLKRRPYLEDLTEILENNPQFEVVYQKNEQSGYKITIFKVK